MREPLVAIHHQEALALPCTVERTTNRAHADMIDQYLKNKRLIHDKAKYALTTSLALLGM